MLVDGRSRRLIKGQDDVKCSFWGIMGKNRILIRNGFIKWKLINKLHCISTGLCWFIVLSLTSGKKITNEKVFKYQSAGDKTIEIVESAKLPQLAHHLRPIFGLVFHWRHITYFFKILWPCRQSMNIKSRNKCWHATAELYNTCKIASIVLPMKEWSFLLYRAKLQGPNQTFSSFSEWINALWLSHFSFICKWKTQKIMGVIWHCFALCCDVTDI